MLKLAALMDWDLHHRHFLLCLSVCCPKPSVTELVQILPGLLQSSVLLPVTWNRGGLIPRWGGSRYLGGARGAHPSSGWSLKGSTDVLCTSQGRWRQSWNGVLAIWNEDPLASHPFQFLLFLQGENNLQMAVCRFCKFFFKMMWWWS